MSLSTKDIVLVVIGTSNCGKSTVIRKGLSPFGLSDSIIVPEGSTSPSSSRCESFAVSDRPALH